MASHAFVEYESYRDGMPPAAPEGVDAQQVQSDLADTEYSTFEHFLDVASRYSAECDEGSARGAWREYFRLDWLHNDRQEPNDESAATAENELDDVAGLYRLNFASSNYFDYRDMKAKTFAALRRHHVEFKSPETGKVIH